MIELFPINEASPDLAKMIEQFVFFDLYRLVDADSYRVYDWHGSELFPQTIRCYDVWNRSSACTNCISRTAVSTGRQIVKLECLEDKVFLIVSMPVTLKGSTMALELIKEVTDSLLVNDTHHQESLLLYDLIRQINDVAVRDLYTGLFNKRYAEQELSKLTFEWDGSVELCIALLDIDHFKQINDTYGHLLGDEAINVLSDILKNYAARGNGWASRMGGDEFLLVYPGLPSKKAEILANELQRTIAEQKFYKNGRSFSISVSIGLSQYHKEFYSWKEFLNAADEAMYLDKKREKNR